MHAHVVLWFAAITRPEPLQPHHQVAQFFWLNLCAAGCWQEVVQRLRGLGLSQAIDLVEGLEAWRRDVDASFPSY